MSTTDDIPFDNAAPAVRGTRGVPPRDVHHHRMAWTLGLLGLVPFVIMVGLLAYAGREFIAYPQIILALSGYSATILAFLGGIRWGHVLTPAPESGRTLLISVLPSLFGWAMLFVPSPFMFAGYALGFAMTGLWDVFAARRGHLPAWFGRLRLVLSLIVTLCQLVAFAATFS
ncbi:DUF3429 domain-containing protein [Jiella sp. MQZ9-1]|uniref:DUF3429 domain-containing protein n=1 Tax=Jiella flava TaxID=2816857 RepID=A0A939G2N5_9HYPH|nr:DUF3429 domain-containing protein [Jiella flava]MBO0663959.1 DUF3429 domain-containing protein [Jiella flava]MCD2472530.1 DUF3429 domain-containing protein [Jiella flava]